MDTSDVETTEHFDDAFRTDVNAIIDHLACGYEAVNAVGLHRSPEKCDRVEQAFFCFTRR